MLHRDHEAQEEEGNDDGHGQEHERDAHQHPKQVGDLCQLLRPVLGVSKRLQGLGQGESWAVWP